MSISVRPFGVLPDGGKAQLFTLSNDSGASVAISDFGGTIVSLCVPDRDGKLTDVVLGYDSVEGYYPNAGYLGAIIGRVGNRIGKGHAVIGGQEVALKQNSHGQHLHGGIIGFDRKIWSSTIDEAQNALMLSYVSPDGEENYPGTLNMRVIYTFSNDNTLTIRYMATTDKETLCNLTNHTYFNLSGEGKGTIVDHEISIAADHVTVVDAQLIPTGALRAVDSTVFDLRKATRVGQGLDNMQSDEQLMFGGGYDNNFCLNGTGLRAVATLYSEATGIQMNTWTDLPGVQFYSGNSLAGVNKAKCGRIYSARDGLCLETQCYPDAVHHKHFPSIALSPGQQYDTTTQYQFLTV